MCTDQPATRMPLVFEGGEIIELREGDSLDVNNGVVTATGTTEPRILKDRFADIINVKDFGAKGDGETDDTAAFIAAQNHAAQKGGVVYVPHGTYNITSPVTGEFISFGHPEIIGTGSVTRLTCLYDDYVHKQNYSGNEDIHGEKTFLDKVNFSGAEVHKNTETHSGAVTHYGSGTYNAFQQFNSGTNIKGGATISGGATVSGGMIVSGAETHNGSGTYNAFQTFNSGTNIKGGATISGGAVVSGGMTVTSGNISGTCTSALSAGTAASCTGNAATATSATNAGTASKVEHDLVLQINGGTNEGKSKYTFNGSADKTLNFSAGANVTLTASSGAMVIAATAPNSVGHAESADTLGSADVGNSSRFIYLNNGSAKATSATIGGVNQPVYISGGVLTPCNSYGSGGSGGSFSGIATAISTSAVVISAWTVSVQNSPHSFYFPSSGTWLALCAGTGAAQATSPSVGSAALGGHIVAVSDASSGYFTTSGSGEGDDGGEVNITAIKLA